MANSLTAVVIGGTPGIGKAIALRFAAEGAEVIVPGRSAERVEAVAEACRKADGKGHFLPCDLADATSVKSLATETVSALGPPRVLVNSGIVLQSGQSVPDQNLSEDEALWRVNHRGTPVACLPAGSSAHADGDR